MKKHDEGYALVFVLVVMTVLSAVAIALMSGALKNLQAQNDAIARMEAKYEAQGLVEKQVGTMMQHIGTVATGTSYLSDAEAIEALTNAIGDLEPVAGDPTACMMNATATLEKETVTVQIVYEVVFRGIVHYGESDGFTIKEPTDIVYNFYSLTYAEPSAPSQQEEAGA